MPVRRPGLARVGSASFMNVNPEADRQLRVDNAIKNITNVTDGSTDIKVKNAEVTGDVTIDGNVSYKVLTNGVTNIANDAAAQTLSWSDAGKVIKCLSD